MLQPATLETTAKLAWVKAGFDDAAVLARFYQRLGYSVVSHGKYLDGVYNGVEDWVIDLAKYL